MEEYLKIRPNKKIYSEEQISKLRNKAIEKIKSKLLPNDQILKIILIGSSVKNTFGEYEPPGFRDSLYSDFDFIIFIKDNYEIPKWLEFESDGKPFPESKMNLAYRSNNFIEDKYDVEVFFIKESTMTNSETQKLGELAGIPMRRDSNHKHLIIYSA